MKNQGPTRDANTPVSASRASLAGLLYSVLCYLSFLGSFGYLALFVNDAFVPRGVGDGTPRGLWAAFAMDLGLVVLWGLQHSVMARRSFKQRWTRLIPAHAERATFVLASSLALSGVMAFWVPTSGSAWQVQSQPLAIALYAVNALGWLLCVAASFEIDHFELFGVKQSLAAYQGRVLPEHRFETKLIYRFVRHPIQTGILVGLWATPDMSASRLCFAALMTGYVMVGLYFEERDLIRHFGERYLRYRREVPKVLPGIRSASKQVEAAPESAPA